MKTAPAEVVEEPDSGTKKDSGIGYAEESFASARLPDRDSFTEKISEQHWKKVSIYQEPGIPYPVRKEEVLHIGLNGETTLKSATAYVASHILVGLKEATIPKELNEIGTLTPIRSYIGNQTYILTIHNWHINSVSDILTQLAGEQLSSFIRYAEPDYLLHGHIEPNDPEYLNGNQWGLNNEIGNYDIRAPEGWDTLTSANDVVVAIIDSGINIDHEDLAGNLWVNPGETPGNGQDDDSNGIEDDIHGLNAISDSGDVEDDNGHGSHVAGILGAVGNNGIGISGVVWNTNLMAVKFLNKEGRGVTSDAIEAVFYAVDQGANVINASWGGPQYSQGLYDAIEYARNAEVLFVASAGNSDANNDSFPTYPASYDLENIISIGSMGNDGSFSHFSNFGKVSVDIAAPGSDILSTMHIEDSQYAKLSGTSMATPHVAGVLALQIQQYPLGTWSDQINRLFQAYQPIDALGLEVRYAGIPNLEESLGIVEPIPGFNFESSLPAELIRFRGQGLELSIALENPDDASYAWYKGGLLLPDETLPKLSFEELRASDSDTYRVNAVKNGFTVSDFTEIVFAQPNLSLKAAADTFLDIGLIAQNHWRSSVSSVAVGSSSLVSGRIPHNCSSSVHSYVEGEGTLSFYWKVSSEPGFDFLNFKVNGVIQQRISGEQNWAKIDFQLSGPGLKILEWEYLKDASVREFEDQAFIDGIDWIPSDESVPLIIENPKGRTLSPGSEASFEVMAFGSDLSFQWFKDGFELSEETASVLTIPAVAESDSGFYRVEVYNEIGLVLSVPVELKVGNFAADIERQPSHVRSPEGVNANFQVVASGTEPLVYQWVKNGEKILDQIGPILNFPSVSPNDQGLYSVSVSNGFTSEAVLSESVTLTVETGFSGPRITKFTRDLLIPRGQSARLNVTAVGSFPLNYQWYFEGEPMLGENTSTVIFPVVDETHVGRYHCQVWNDFGSVTSWSVDLSIFGNIGDPIEQPLLDWVFSNETQLILKTDNTHDGEDSLLITGGPNQGPTFIQTTVEGPAEISFWYLPTGGGFGQFGSLYFILNGAVEAQFGFGASEFQNYTFQIEEGGRHEIRFVVTSFLTDSSFYLDELIIDRTPLAPTDPVAHNGPPGLDVVLPLEIVSLEPFSIEWYRNNQLLVGENAEILKLGSVSPADSAEYHAIITNEFGSKQSGTFSVNVFEETINETLGTSGINFEYEGEGYWYPQSEDVHSGGSALKSPEFAESTSSIVTKVQGPISGEFYGRELDFQIEGIGANSQITQNTIPSESHKNELDLEIDENVVTHALFEGEWFRWKFDLKEDQMYELRWTNYEGIDGFLDSVKFFPPFYLESDYNSTIGLFPGDSFELFVSVPGSQPTNFQWYRNFESIPGAIDPSLVLLYDEIETNDYFYVVATRGDLSIEGGWVSLIKHTVNIGGEETPFEHEGITFLTTGDSDWVETNLEPTASDGVSLFPGTIAGDFGSGGWVNFLRLNLNGPGELSFRIRNDYEQGFLHFFRGQQIQDETFIDSFYKGDDWVDYTYKVRTWDFPQHTFEFTTAQLGAIGGDITIFLDDFVYRSAPVLQEPAVDRFPALGSTIDFNLSVISNSNPVTIQLFKNGIFQSDLTGQAKLTFSSIVAEDGGEYEIRLTAPGGTTSSEFFNIRPLASFSSVLNSNIIQWELSHDQDWETVTFDEVTGEQGLLTNIGQVSPQQKLDQAKVKKFWIRTSASGPGKFHLKYQAYEFIDRGSDITLKINGSPYRSLGFSPDSDWIDFEVDFEEEIQRTLELSYNYAPGRGDSDIPLLIDKFTFHQIFWSGTPLNQNWPILATHSLLKCQPSALATFQ